MDRERDAARLWQLSGGNPLLLREVLDAARGQETLIETEGVWRWQRGLRTSGRLQTLIEERLGRLTGSERQVLELVALAEPLEAAVAERLVPAALLARLEVRGLPVALQQGRRVSLMLAHPLYSELVGATLRGRALRRRLAEAVEATGAKRHGDLLRIARWQMEAGSVPSGRLLVAAAEQAQAVFEAGLAERLARCALDVDGASVQAMVVLGEALVSQGRFVEAEALLARCEPGPGEDAVRVRAAVARAGGLFWGQGRTTEAIDVLRRVAGKAGGADARDELRAVEGWFAVFRGRPREAIDAAAGALARPGASERAAVCAGLAVAPALSMTGAVGELRALHRRLHPAALRLARELPQAADRLDGSRGTPWRWP